jgi:hypothetical protein
MADTNIQGGPISTDPNAMTIGEYVLENIRRLNEAGNNESLPERERAIRKAQAAELQRFYDTQIKNVKSQNGGNLGDQYANRMNNLFKDMFQKASGIKFGELQGQENQTQMELPEAVKQAMQSFVGSDQNKVANSNVLTEQVNNIHKIDDATAAGQGYNSPAAKKAQDTIRDSRKLVNDVKIDGVQDIPVTDAASDGYYTEGENTGDGNNTPPKNDTDPPKDDDGKPKPTEQDEGLSKLLLADILMTGVRNALHYRPAFRTAYGEDIEGRDFGTEKSLAMKLAEENMKRGLERSNMRKDTEAKTEAEVKATKKKGGDKEYGKAKQNLEISSGTQTTAKNETKVRPWGTTQISTTGTVPINLDQNWNNVRTSD